MAEIAQQASVTADVNFVVDNGGPIINYPSQAGGEKSKSIGEYEFKTVTIHDARALAANLSLDREGFARVNFEPTVTDFYEPDQIENIYNDELIALLKRVTGARDVFVFDHTLRAGDENIRSEKKVREPVQRAHNDYTIRSGPTRVIDFFGEEAAKPLLERRFAIINVWRPTVGAVEEFPLAICDARSVAQDDFVRSIRQAKERTGETYRLAYNANHKWFYFPLMQPNEAMLIKSYDSLEDGTARFTPHSAFVDPNTRPDARPRQSIESRLFAFF
jgi:hypothetical protein